MPVIEVTRSSPVPIEVENIEFALDVTVWAEKPIVLSAGVGLPGPSGVLQMIFGEIPTGIIDGLNKDYASAYLYQPNKLAVFLNGLRLRRTDDYIETGNQSFRFADAPLPGDSLSIDYIQP